MAQVSRLVTILNGLVTGVDLTSSDLVTNSVWVGGTGSAPSVQVTPSLLNSFLTAVTAGNSGISVSGGSAISAVAGDGIQISSGIAVDTSVIRTSGANAFAADQSMGSHKLTNLATPTVSTDAVTKGYVDGLIAGGGTVTSVAFSDASTSPIYGVSGSPITTSGTISITLNTQSANAVLAGPTSGGAAQPTFRSLVSSDIPDLSATYVTQAEVGAVNGVASLDSAGKVPVSQLPNSVMEYKGTYDPTGGGTPALADGSGNTGDVYRVSVAGSHDFGSGSISFVVGDYVIYNGSIWEKSHSGADAVISVNGAAGAVTVNAINELTGDVTAGPASGSASAAATVAKIQGTTVSGTTGSSNVVFSQAPTIVSPSITFQATAGQSFSANTTYVVRWALNGETAGRIYAADASSAAANLQFYGIGFIQPTGAITAGQTVQVSYGGAIALQSGDTSFGATLVGLPIWLNTTGGFTTTQPTTSGYASYRVGVVLSTTQIWVLPAMALDFINN